MWFSYYCWTVGSIDGAMLMLLFGRSYVFYGRYVCLFYYLGTCTGCCMCCGGTTGACGGGTLFYCTYWFCGYYIHVFLGCWY